MLATSERTVVWFSCGAASAVAAKMAVEKYGDPDVVYCDTLASEHPDNARFFGDIQRWIGKSITVIKSAKYEDIDDVFERERYMAGIAGARCTVEMKKVPRLNYQRADDIHIFGYTVDEHERIEKFKKNNPELTLDWILRDRFIRKVDCYRILEEAGIALPEMYALGFEHNNCAGCVKATSPSYWQRTAKHFPEVFARRAKQSREIGARLVRIQGVRCFLDEMPLDAEYSEPDGDIECGPYCSPGLFDASLDLSLRSQTVDDRGLCSISPNDLFLI